MGVSANVIRGKIVPLKNHVLISDMEFGERRTRSGLIFMSDDGKEDGIRPRWGKVVAIGPTQADVKVGDWVLVDHGRWTRGVNAELDGEIKTLRMVDPKDILGTQQEEPEIW